MADNDRDVMAETPQQRRDYTSDQDLDRAEVVTGDRDAEREQVRSSNDRDQQLEREGTTSRHNRGYDEAAHGEGSNQVDPDSAFSDVDRDDTIDE